MSRYCSGKCLKLSRSVTKRTLFIEISSLTTSFFHNVALNPRLLISDSLSSLHEKWRHITTVNVEQWDTRLQRCCSLTQCSTKVMDINVIFSVLELSLICFLWDIIHWQENLILKGRNKSRWN